MTDEQIVGIIPGVHAGVFGQKAYNIIIFDDKIIIAQLTKAMMNEEVKKAAEESKNKGEGMMKRWASTMKVGFHLHERYFSMNSDQIMNETPGNIILMNDAIKSVRIKMGQTYQDGRHQPNTIKIDEINGKLKYTFTMMTAKEAKDILLQSLGSKVK